MAEFKDMLKYFREREGLSQFELSKKLGVAPSTIGMYEQGRRQPSFEVEETLADIFNVDIATLRGKPGPSAVKLQVLGRVAAGIPIEMITDIVDDEEISVQMGKAGDYFALRIKGNSMEPIINDGDNVIVKKQPDVDTGDIAIVAVNGDDATCKRIRKHRDGIELIPANPSFEVRFFTNEEIQSIPVTILGKVVELRRKL